MKYILSTLIFIGAVLSCQKDDITEPVVIEPPVVKPIVVDPPKVVTPPTTTNTPTTTVDPPKPPTTTTTPTTVEPPTIDGNFNLISVEGATIKQYPQVDAKGDSLYVYTWEAEQDYELLTIDDSYLYLGTNEVTLNYHTTDFLFVQWRNFIHNGITIRVDREFREYPGDQHARDVLDNIFNTVPEQITDHTKRYTLVQQTW